MPCTTSGETGTEIAEELTKKKEVQADPAVDEPPPKKKRTCGLEGVPTPRQLAQKGYLMKNSKRTNGDTMHTAH